MKIKSIIIIMILVLLSGCNAIYNLEIKENNASIESLIIKDYTKYYSKEDVAKVVPSFFEAESNIEYSFDKDNNLIIVRYKKGYSKLNHNKEIEEYFGNIKLNRRKIIFKPNYDKCIFMFSEGGEYITNDEVEVNVTLPFNIIETNADKVNGNVYTWVYGINDCNKEAYIKIKNSGIIFYIIIGAVLIGISIYVFIKRRKNNEMY